MTQTREERRAYLRAYRQRPEVIARRRAWHQERRARMTREELAERRAYDRQWREDQRAQMSDEEREVKRAKDRDYRRERRAKKRSEA